MKKCALITGACKNTGVAIVSKFLGNGFPVIFTGRNPDSVAEAEKKYRAAYPGTEVYGFAVNSLKDDKTVDEEGVERLFAFAEEKDLFAETIVLNGADQGLNQKIFENPLGDFMKVLNSNVTWNYKIIDTFGRKMRDQRDGNIIFINSNTAYRAIPDRIAYETSKGAQLGMMRGLALDLGKFGIRVNAILPGMIRTNRWIENPDFYKTVPSRYTPLGDVADGSDIADGVWYFTTMARNTTGAELTIDGGNTIQLYPIVPKD